MKTLAILTGSFPPTNIVGALRPFRLAKHIGRRGWKVLVLTHPPKSGQALDQTLLGELDHQHEIQYIRREYESAKSGWGLRVAGVTRDVLQKWVKPDIDIIHIPAYIRHFKWAKKKQNIDVILTTSPAHSIHLAGLWVKYKFKLPWVVDFRDPWDDYLKTGIARITNPLERYFEKQVITKADAVISTTNMYTDVLSSRYPDVAQEKFFTITNSFDRQKTFNNVEKSNDKFIICYTGIFYPSKDPYGFFRALRRWFDTMDAEEKLRYRNRLEIHLIGSADRITRQVIHDLELGENVIFFERMSHENAIKKTMQADMALISTGLGLRTRPGWLPSKFFEYLGCRIPILALTREGELAEIIRRTNSGYVITTERDEDKIGPIIRQMMHRKFYIRHDGQDDDFRFIGIECFEEEYVMRKFIFVIEELPLTFNR